MDRKIANIIALAQLYVLTYTEDNPHDAFYRALRELHPTAGGMIRREMPDDEKHLAPSIDWMLRWLWNHAQVVA